MDVKLIAKTLGLSEDAGEDAVIAAIKAAADAAKPGATQIDYLKALGLDDSSEPNKRIAAALNQKDEQIIALQAEATDLKAKIAEGAKLNDRIAELEKRDRDRDVEIILTKAVETGRALPAEKEKLAEMFSDNVAGLRSLMATRPAGFFLAKEKGTSAAGRSVPADMSDPDMVALARELGASDDPLDEGSARLHHAALAILKERGKEHEYTADDYAAALAEADRTGVAR